jgi:polyketide biosynthesis enoyl-CoA hydratase PksI
MTTIMSEARKSEVVSVRETKPGVVQITMEDRVSKNTFSEALTRGLLAAFDRVRSDTHCRAVVLTGYDTYFASGGTREGLLAIHEGKAKFTDVNIYGLALDCPVPVISAMQGHGIGGGFVMGLFSDIVVMSRESVYTTNFMKYGFTPGMGATYILPKKLGIVLAEEMLLTAESYRGADLERRGVPFSVLPRAQVLEHAHEVARQLAEKPRVSLVTLKDHLVASMRAELAPVIQSEVLMHDKTFHQPEVKERIEALFGR